MHSNQLSFDYIRIINKGKVAADTPVSRIYQAILGIDD
jgi:hypothetical protein